MSMNSNPTNISINEKYLEGRGNFDIISVFGKKNLEEIQRIVSDVTGIAFITVDYKGEPVTEQTGFTRFCKSMREDKRHFTMCKLSDASGSIIAATTKRTSIYFCPCGLLEIAIPIIVNERYLGGFIGGQVICKDAPDSVMRLNKNIVPGGSDLEEMDIFSPKMKEYLADFKEYAYSEFLSISKLVELIINQLTKQELISGHNKMKNLNRIKVLEERVKELEYEKNFIQNKYDELKRVANLFFVRNTFNVISNLAIIEGANKTNNAILKYSKFIDKELKSNGENTIRTELQRVEHFLEINKIRYESRVNYKINFDDALLDKKMMFSLIVAFVHSSIYYSLTLNESNYFLTIDIYSDDKNIYVEIEDNGPGLTVRELEQKYKLYGENHEGIEIVNSLVNLTKSVVDVFGEEYRIKFNCEKGKGSKITIKYPIDYDEGV